MNYPKFTQICPILFKLNTCPAFLEYVLFIDRDIKLPKNYQNEKAALLSSECIENKYFRDQKIWFRAT